MATPRPASRLPRLGRALGLIAPLGLAAFPAHAATIEARSRIEQVTLYPDAAIVTRSVTIDLPAGNHDVLLPDLPMNADPASLRVEASGSGRLMLGGIDLRLGVAEARADAELEARLKAKREARDRNADRMDSAETRKAMVQRLAQLDPAPKDGRPLDLESWLNAVDAVGKTTQALNDELRGLRMEEARIAEEIAALETAIGQPGAQNPRRVAAIAVEAPEALRATLTVSYRVAGASWRPVYDARLETRGAKPSLELTRRALIRQRTGEDWREAKVVVSTLRIQRELGLLYDSSLMADDDAYELLENGEATGIVELPVEWIRDDAVYFNMNRFTGLRPYTPPADVYDIFLREFERAYDEGGLFLLTMHPHVIGHRSRIALLDRLVQHMKSFGDVWFATHEEVARWCKTEAGMQ
jgi:hypothetical protein